MNNMQPLAKAIQSQGRGNDSMLVHMTPSEVGGLQTLAQKYNRSLSINPSTGLPEAGFLEDILPTLAGAALVVGSGGTLTPLMAAGIVGGGTAVVTGDIEKGLTAGLGAYGGGGLGAGLTASGAAATPGGITSGTKAVEATTVDGVTKAAIPAGPPSINPNVISPTIQTTGQNFKLAGEGLTNLGSEAGREAFVQGLSKNKAGQLVGTSGDLIKYGISSVTPMLEQEPYEYKKKTGQIKNYDYDPGTQNVAYRTGARDEDTDELRYFRPRFFAMGGLANLNNRGEYLRGMGDGMSDTIPANIDNIQEAALSDGEFVIPADVVSHLGNGSSNAGAKRLYAMMDNIRKERTGKEKQAPAVNVNKVMPA